MMIDDFFNEKEYEDVWNELMKLNNKMLTPEYTYSAKNKNGEFIKKNLGICLCDPSVVSEKASQITVNIINNLKKLVESKAHTYNIQFYKLPFMSHAPMMVHKYKDGDYYESHVDNSLYSVVLCLHKKPKKYTGGLLNFPKHNKSFDLDDNQAILFPSSSHHEVTKVSLNSNDDEDARYTITDFLKTLN
jgi:Rps23 Pro-64 3,4-dihydroxylase Tpa1-like proline 4-hydroxylase